MWRWNVTKLIKSFNVKFIRLHLHTYPSLISTMGILILFFFFIHLFVVTLKCSHSRVAQSISFCYIFLSRWNSNIHPRQMPFNLSLARMRTYYFLNFYKSFWLFENAVKIQTRVKEKLLRNRTRWKFDISSSWIRKEGRKSSTFLFSIVLMSFSLDHETVKISLQFRKKRVEIPISQSLRNRTVIEFVRSKSNGCSNSMMIVIPSFITVRQK